MFKLKLEGIARYAGFLLRGGDAKTRPPETLTNVGFKELYRTNIFAGPKKGQPTPGFSIFIRLIVRSFDHSFVRPSP